METPEQLSVVNLELHYPSSVMRMSPMAVALFLFAMTSRGSTFSHFHDRKLKFLSFPHLKN